MRALVRFVAHPALALLAACGGTKSAGTPAAPAPKATPAAAAAPAPASAPTGFEYTPSTSQYRLTAAARITQSMMGQSQDAETSQNLLVSITIARAGADTLAVTLVVDSITLVGAMGMTPPGADKVPGNRYAMKTSPAGVVYSATGPSEAESPLGFQMTNEMSRLLPRIRAILRTGATWTDTLSDTPKQNGLELKRQVVSRYTVVGDSTVNGEVAWKISRESETTTAGSGAPQGQQVTLETKATGKGVILMSKRGVLLGGESTESSDGMAKLVANSMEIGLKSTSTTKVLKVK